MEKTTKPRSILKPQVKNETDWRAAATDDEDVQQVESRSLSVQGKSRDNLAGRLVFNTMHDFLPMEQPEDIKPEKEKEPEPMRSVVSTSVVRRPLELRFERRSSARAVPAGTGSRPSLSPEYYKALWKSSLEPPPSRPKFFSGPHDAAPDEVSSSEPDVSAVASRVSAQPRPLGSTSSAATSKADTESSGSSVKSPPVVSKKSIVPAAAPTPKLSAAPTPKLSVAPTPKLSAAPTPKLSAAPTPKLSAAPTPKLSAAPTSKMASAPTSQLSKPISKSKSVSFPLNPTKIPEKKVTIISVESSKQSKSSAQKSTPRKSEAKSQESSPATQERSSQKSSSGSGKSKTSRPMPGTKFFAIKPRKPETKSRKPIPSIHERLHQEYASKTNKAYESISEEASQPMNDTDMRKPKTPRPKPIQCIEPRRKFLYARRRLRETYTVTGTRFTPYEIFPNVVCSPPESPPPSPWYGQVEGTLISERDTTDHVLRNALSVVRNPAKIPVPHVAENVYGRTKNFRSSGLARFYVFKPDYGRIPGYIYGRRYCGMEFGYRENDGEFGTQNYYDFENDNQYQDDYDLPFDHEFCQNYYSLHKWNPASGRLDRDPISWVNFLMNRDPPTGYPHPRRDAAYHCRRPGQDNFECRECEDIREDLAQENAWYEQQANPTRQTTIRITELESSDEEFEEDYDSNEDGSDTGYEEESEPSRESAADKHFSTNRK